MREHLELFLGEEAVEVERVLAYGEVCVEGDGAAGGEGTYGAWGVDEVTDAAHVHNGRVEVELEEGAGDTSDHGDMIQDIQYVAERPTVYRPCALMYCLGTSILV